MSPSTLCSTSDGLADQVQCKYGSGARFVLESVLKLVLPVLNPPLELVVRPSQCHLVQRWAANAHSETYHSKGPSD